MSGPLTLRPDAVLDVEDAFRYLSNARTGVGPQFLARLREVSNHKHDVVVIVT